MIRLRPRLVLAAVFVLFAGPLLVAMMMHSNRWGFEPSKHDNHGMLIEPPVPLDLDSMDIRDTADSPARHGASRWVLLYPYAEPCSPACRRDIRSLRQIHLAAGRHRARVMVLLVSPQHPSPATRRMLAKAYSEFKMASDTGGAVSAALERLRHRHLPRATGVDGQAFLLDPPGNIILAYAPGFDPNHIHQDLSRLLKWSAEDLRP